MSNVSIPYNYPKKCPCCNEGIIQDLHDVCLICGKERSRNKKYMWCNTWK